MSGDSPGASTGLWWCAPGARSAIGCWGSIHAQGATSMTSGGSCRRSSGVDWPGSPSRSPTFEKLQPRKGVAYAGIEMKAGRGALSRTRAINLAAGDVAGKEPESRDEMWTRFARALHERNDPNGSLY